LRLAGRCRSRLGTDTEETPAPVQLVKRRSKDDPSEGTPTRTERRARLDRLPKSAWEGWPVKRPQNGSSLSTGHSKRKKGRR
jgi:hypothetical protein